MNKWKSIHISDIGKIVTGKTPKTSVKENYGGNIPFLTPSDDLSNKYAPNTNKKITVLGLEEVKNCLLPPNSVCVSCIGSDLGKVVMLREHSVTNQQFNSIIPNDEFCPDYIYYLMTIVGKELNFIGKTSTAVPIVNKSSFSNTEVKIPSFPTQQKIANILSSLDDKIEVNRRINEQLEELAQALFKSWFVDFEPFKDGEFVESELGMIPEGWKVGTFSDVVDSTLGGDWGKETEQGNYTKEVFCIRGADIPEIKNGNRGKMPIRFILQKNYEKKSLNNNDLVVEISGGSPTQSTGRICRVTSELLEKYNNSLICTNFCRAIKPLAKYSAYIYYYWQYLYDKGAMFNYENGTIGIKNLMINDILEKEPIIIPSIGVVEQYNNVVETFAIKIQKNGEEIEKLSNLRDTLLPKLMSGEIDVNEVTI